MICQELQSGPCCSRATEGSVERHCTAVATPCQVTSAVELQTICTHTSLVKWARKETFMKYCLIVFSFCFNQSIKCQKLMHKLLSGDSSLRTVFREILWLEFLRLKILNLITPPDQINQTAYSTESYFPATATIITGLLVVFVVLLSIHL